MSAAAAERANQTINNDLYKYSIVIFYYGAKVTSSQRYVNRPLPENACAICSTSRMERNKKRNENFNETHTHTHRTVARSEKEKCERNFEIKVLKVFVFFLSLAPLTRNVPLKVDLELR